MEENMQEKSKRTVKDFIFNSLSSLKGMVTKQNASDEVSEHLKENNLSAMADIDQPSTKAEDVDQKIKTDMRMFHIVLSRDKSYGDAIDMLQTYDNGLSQNSNPEHISATREMFSAILDKVGYETAAEHLNLDRDINNFNRLFGIQEQKSVLDVIPENVSVPGLDETEVRKHLIDMAEMEKAYLLNSTKNAEELYMAHVSEHDLEVMVEGKPESQYQLETEELSHKTEKTQTMLETATVKLNAFITFNNDKIKNILDTTTNNDIPTKEKQISMNKKDIGLNVKTDIEKFKTVLNQDKNYTDAIDILQEYDKKLSLQPDPIDVATTRDMFSKLLEKAGHETAAVHLDISSEINNLNKLFGLDGLKTVVDLDKVSAEIHVPGLDDIEVRKHLVDLAKIEKATHLNSIGFSEELYNTHVNEHDFSVMIEKKSASEYHEETEKLSDQVSNVLKIHEPTIKNLDTFINKESRYIGILTDLNALNIDTNELKKSGEINNLLTYGRTSELITTHLSVGDNDIDFKARLSVKTDEEGKVHLQVHPKRDLETELSKGFAGHTFTEEEKGNLLALGCAGHVISAKDKEGREENFLIGTDSLTNELVSVLQKDITIKDEFRGVTLTDKKKEDLRNGQPIFLEGIKNGSIECSSLVQYNIEKGRLEMLPYGLKISSIQNIKLQKEQQDMLKEGKTVLISGLFDGKDVKYNAWVRLDMKNMKLMKSKEMPEKQVEVRKEIISSTDHRVQVAQNTHGVKTEKNKFSSTPLFSGKQTPSEGTDERKNKRHKM